MKQLILFLPLLLAAISFLLHPDLSASAVMQGFHLCTSSVIPSLYPYFFLTNFCMSQGIVQSLGRKIMPVLHKFFHLSAEGSAVAVIGAIAGFPVGGQTAIDLYENGSIEKEEAEHLLMFCSNAGPAFVIGFVGGSIFQSARIGLLLWLIHITGALLIGYFFRRKTVRAKPLHTAPAEPVFQSLSQAVIDSAFAMFRVCAFIILFGILLSHLSYYLPAAIRNSRLIALLLGSVELTNGIGALSGHPPQYSFAAAAGLLGWNGLCVHFQVLSARKGKPLSLCRYFAGKLLHAMISVILAWILSHFIPLPLSCSLVYTGDRSWDFWPILAIGSLIIKTSTGNTAKNRI